MAGAKTSAVPFVAVGQRMGTTWRKVGKFTKEISTVEPGFATRIHTIMETTTATSATKTGEINNTNPNIIEGVPVHFQ